MTGCYAAVNTSGLQANITEEECLTLTLCILEACLLVNKRKALKNYFWFYSYDEMSHWKGYVDGNSTCLISYMPTVIELEVNMTLGPLIIRSDDALLTNLMLLQPEFIIHKSYIEVA
jgi:hypothetical protein